jgi:gliding motility-associated-like protein
MRTANQIKKQERSEVNSVLRVLLTAAVFMLIANFVTAQDIKQPNLMFEYACPQQSFNNFEVAVEIVPSNFSNDNLFFIELSDANGDFSSPEILDVVASQNTEVFFYSEFAFNQNIYGEQYSIRVRSTSPETISVPSESFQAHYVSSTFMVLNNYEDVSLCGAGNSATVSLDITDNGTIQHWFKDGLFYQAGTAELIITEPGLYYAETFLGNCTGLRYSNVITVTTGADIPVEISPATTATIKEGETFTFEASGADSYVWTDKNGSIVSETSTFNASREGQYIVTATKGACTTSKTVTVMVEAIDFANDDSVVTNLHPSRENNKIPNFISPNGDNINDNWILPAQFVNDPSVKVTIFNTTGATVLSATNYQNDWSGQNVAGFSKVVYYTISKNGVIVKKGSLTILS